jgi:hypothetical protein
MLIFASLQNQCFFVIMNFCNFSLEGPEGGDAL